MQAKVIGYTTKMLPIMSYEFNNSGKNVLIMGGVHGDEVEGVIAARSILAELLKSNPYKINITVIPEMNPEGVLAKTRSNSNGIDLNRNLPTKDWTSEVLNPRYNPGPSAASEPESKVMMQVLESKKWDFIYSLHSWKPLLNPNGNCSPTVEVLSKLTGYIIEPTMGYPTPGCLGTYAGMERNIPTVTYEIERGMDYKAIVELHTPAILESLKTLEG